MLWRKISKEENTYHPETKAAHSMERIGNKLYLFGGWNGRYAIDTLESLDISKMRWSQLTSTGEKPSARNNHASCCMNENIYIHGGHDGEVWLNDLYVLNTSTLKWEKIVQNGNSNLVYTPRAKACHTLSRIGRKIYVYGGYDGKGSFSDIEVFDLETSLWTNIKIQNSILSSFPNITPRNSHSTVVYNKKLYIFGGHYQNQHLNDLIIFDTKTNNLSSPELSGDIPPGLRGHTASLLFNKMYIFGGYDGHNRKNDVYRLNLEDFTFTKFSMDKDKIVPRQKHSATVTAGFKILYFGGFDGTKWSNTIDELDVSILESGINSTNSLKRLEINFRELINSKEYSDLTLVVENKEIFAHKCILFARCEYFRNMFSDYMMEKNSTVLHIQECDYETFTLFIEFVYTSHLENTSPKLICKLCQLADLYAFESLKKYCEDLLCLSIDVENVIDAYVLSYHCNSLTLESSCLDFISKNRKLGRHFFGIDKLVAFPNLMLKILSILT